MHNLQLTVNRAETFPAKTIGWLVVLRSASAGVT